MESVEELIAERDRLETEAIELAKKQASVERRLAEAAREFQPGERVMYRGQEYEIAEGMRLRFIARGKPFAAHYGRRVLKSGEVGSQVFELYHDTAITSIPKEGQPK